MSNKEIGCDDEDSRANLTAQRITLIDAGLLDCVESGLQPLQDRIGNGWELGRENSNNRNYQESGKLYPELYAEAARFAVGDIAEISSRSMPA